jgi:hypothetical protein
MPNNLDAYHRVAHDKLAAHGASLRRDCKDEFGEQRCPPGQFIGKVSR